MRARTATAATLSVLALALTACSSDDPAPDETATASSSPAPASPADARGYDSAQAIADALAGAGLKVSKPQENTEQTYISEVGGKAYKLTITDGDQAPGEAGINMFPNPEALNGWIPLSKQFGGVAVTADTWAVSLPTDGAARDDSVRLAPKVAEALDGTVQK
ncbi:hypothetical protein ACGF3J_37395 [Streptomyces sp. NPDC048171]|uniref:hypothetical protein n=1 Tax=Streptomyces sp. NPDC048171 TaxID=3365504 RepID=UPI00371D7BEC